jgi:23S rRNA pseudouridine1911/1915/1917 synthase
VRYTVPAAVSLGDCLARLLAGASGRTRKQMLAGDRVRVNGTVVRRGNSALVAGDVVEVGPRGPRAVLPPGLIHVYEDDDVIVVDKPAGLLTIATERERERTAYTHLMAHARARRPLGRVFVVHRLDRLVSGLLVFATSPAAKRTLQAQFAAHTVERAYLAVVEGRPARAEGTITSRLLDDAPGRVRETRRPGRGRLAVTRWRVRRAGERHALLEIRLETGRRNQIRVHLANAGHPIAGDAAYGCRTDPWGRLALHAHVLGFDHPRTGVRLRFVSPAPSAFAKLPTRRGILHRRADCAP